MRRISAKPLGQAEIGQGLRAFGLVRGDVLEVHSSLSSLGWVQGGASTVVDALMNVVGPEGTLVMSAYPVSKPLPLTKLDIERGIRAKVQIFGEDYVGPTGMGAIADTFRSRPGTVLGQGVHRVCAWGHEARAYSAGYAALLDNHGYVLLLGVGIGSCSSMHQAEHYELPDEIKSHFRVPDDIRQHYAEDIHLAYGSTPRDPWETVLAEAERQGLVKRETLGKAACLLFKARAMVAVYEHALATDPWALFGMPKS